MQATIVNFRGSHKTQKCNHIILKVSNIKKEAEQVLNKKVTWKTPSGKLITGKITSLHGNTGAVRAIFEKGLPGQALGKKVSIE